MKYDVFADVVVIDVLGGFHEFGCSHVRLTDWRFWTAARLTTPPGIYRVSLEDD
jgi:hypothetical protein